MLKIFKMAILSKAILAPAIPYIAAFTCLRWSRQRNDIESDKQSSFFNFLGQICHKNRERCKKKIQGASAQLSVRKNKRTAQKSPHPLKPKEQVCLNGKNLSLTFFGYTFSNIITK